MPGEKYDVRVEGGWQRRYSRAAGGLRSEEDARTLVIEITEQIVAAVIEITEQIVAAFMPAMRAANEAVERLVQALVDALSPAHEYEFARRVAGEHGITEADIREWTVLPGEDWRYVVIRTWNGRVLTLDSEGPRRRVWGHG